MNIDFQLLIDQGKEKWNDWMSENSMTPVDIGGFNLSNRDLSGYDFSVVTACYTNFTNSKLSNTDFSHADLSDAILQEADITDANFDNANLTGANLTKVIAVNADFYQATLEGANLSYGIFQKAQFAMSRLVNSKLDNADITDAILWESQRVLWSIKDIMCERCFWGEYKKDPPSEYTKGEFEKLHQFSPTIKIHFAQGIKPIEFYSLSHFVHGVENFFEDCKMRISSISEAGKGAEVNIILEEHLSEQYNQIEGALNYLPQFMRANNQINYLEGVNKGLQISMDKLIKELMENNITKIGKIEANNSIISTGANSSINMNIESRKEELITLLDAFINDSRDEDSKNVAKELLNELKVEKDADVSLIKSLSKKLSDMIIGAAGSGTWEILAKALQSIV